MQSHFDDGLTFAGNTRDSFFAAPANDVLTARRDRLFARLNLPIPITVVQASAGWGKTALLTSWALGRTKEIENIAWLEAHDGPDGANAFRQELSSTIERFREAGVFLSDAFPLASAAPVSHAGTGPLPRQRSASNRPPPAQRVVLLIENGDLLLGSEEVEMVCTLVRLNENLEVILNSRVVHPIGPVAHSLGLPVEIIGRSDLAADSLELQSFAKMWGHEITSHEADDLHHASGGWPLLARTILDDASDRTAPLQRDQLREALCRRVFHELNEAPLLHTAELLALSAKITVDQTHALLSAIPSEVDDFPHGSTPLKAADAADAADLIWRLEQIGVVERTPSDSDVPAWVFDPSLRAELARSLTTSRPELAALVHRTLSQHLFDLEDTSGLGEALEHARKGGDFDTLTRAYLIYGVQLILDFPAQASAAFGLLSDETFTEHPVLALPAALVRELATVSTDDERSVLLRATLWAGRRRTAGAAEGATIDETIALVTTEMVTKRANGSTKDALELARRFSDHLTKRQGHGDLEPGSIQRAAFWMEWAETWLLAGDLSRAAVLTRTAFECTDQRISKVVAASAASQMALIQTLRGESTSAEKWLAHYENLKSDQWVDSLTTLPAAIAAIYRGLDRLDPHSAEAAIADTGDASQTVEYWPFIAQALTQHALLYGEPFVMLARFTILVEAHPLSLSEDGSARRIVDRCKADLLLALGELNRASDLLTSVLNDGPWLHVPRARLAFLAGDFSAAEDFAATGAWHPDCDPSDRVELTMIHAQAMLALGELDNASRTFTRAHELASQMGTLRPYAAMPSATLDILLTASGTKFTGDEEQRLAQTRQIYPTSGELIKLSPREDVVLQSLNTGASVAEIAVSLGVSVNTIKKQVLRLYSKLGVADRASAISRAGLLGLFHHIEPGDHRRGQHQDQALHQTEGH